MRTQFKSVFWIFAVMILALPITATAKPGPGPVVLTFMERVEYHSDATNSDGNIGEETFLYSLISAYRQLDENVSGNIYYLNKYSFDDGDTASHIGGLSITHNISGKWNMSYSYSYSSNPERDPINNPGDSTSDRLSFGLTYKVNPGEKARKRYSLKTTYSVPTDFGFGQTLSEKLTVSDDLTKRANYALGYQFVWGLSDNPAMGMYRTHFANQWSLDLNYKLSKTDKIGLGVLLIDNLYHGARSDDTVLRLSYFKTVQ